MCQKCHLYLHDYFEQPIDKENPSYSFVNQKKLQEKREELIPIVLRLLFSVVNIHLLKNAKSDMENYCSFVAIPKNQYETYELLYTFMKRKMLSLREISLHEDMIADLNFIKIRRTDKTEQNVKRWLAILIGSLFEDMYQLHKDHSKQTPFYQLDITKGLPGRPYVNHLKKKQEKRFVKVIVIDDDDDLEERKRELEEIDDLYT